MRHINVIMAGKQLDVPHDIVNLKRPALQKLCKQLGLKANGKNTEMVRLLEEYREKTSLEHTEDHSCSQREPNFAREAQHSGLDSSGERSESSESLPVSEARGGDNENLLVRDEEETENTGGGRRKRRRGRGKRERSKTVTKPTVTDGQEFTSDERHWPNVTTETAPQSDLEKETHITLCAGDSSKVAPGLLLPREIDQNGSVVMPKMVPIHSQSDSEKESHTLFTDDPSVENTGDISPQVDVATEDFRERRRTFSISPKPASFSSIVDQNAAPLSTPSVDVVMNTPATNTPTSGSRKRRRTHSVSPASSLLLSGIISMEMGTMATETMETEEPSTDVGDTVQTITGGCEGGAATDEMMALLDKRVAERKAGPGCVSPPSLLTQDKITETRIPMSKTIAMINKAHDKEFSKMSSILEFSERKKKRALALQKGSTPAPPTKKQKVAPKTPATDNKLSIKKSTLTKSRVALESKKPSGGPTIVRPVIPKSTNVKPKTTTAVHFEPKLSSRDGLFNFGKTSTIATPSSLSKMVKTAPKSASRPFTFSAQSKTLSENSRFKPHKGKLPEFNFSIF